MSVQQPSKSKKMKLDDLTTTDVDDLTSAQLRTMMREVRTEVRGHTKRGIEFLGEEQWSDQMYEMSKSAIDDIDVCTCCIGELFVDDASSHELTTEEKRKLVKLYVLIRDGVAFAVDCAQAEYFAGLKGF